MRRYRSGRLRPCRTRRLAGDGRPRAAGVAAPRATHQRSDRRNPRRSYVELIDIHGVYAIIEPLVCSLQPGSAGAVPTSDSAMIDNDRALPSIASPLKAANISKNRPA